MPPTQMTTTKMTAIVMSPTQMTATVYVPDPNDRDQNDLDPRFSHDIPLKCSTKIGSRTLCKWFLDNFSLKGGLTLGCRALWIFHFKVEQNLVAEHWVSDFYMIFHLKAAQHLVAEHSEFSTLRWIKTCWRALWNIILTWFSPSKRLKT